MTRREKARRKMTTKEDLLFNDVDMPEPKLPVKMLQAAKKQQQQHPSLNPPNSSNINPAVKSGAFTRSLSFTKPKSDLMFNRSRSFVKPEGPSNYLMRFHNNVNSQQHNQYSRGGVPNHSQDFMTQSADQNSIISRLAPVYQPSPVVGRRNWGNQHHHDQR